MTQLNEDGEQMYKFTKFDQLSLANISQGSHRMWAHIGSVYIITFLILRVSD